MNLPYKLSSSLLAIGLFVAAVPSPERSASMTVVLPGTGDSNCVCDESHRLLTPILATETTSSGSLIVIASHTAGQIKAQNGRCHSNSCERPAKDCMTTVDIRVSVHAMGTWPGNVFWLGNTPLSVGQSKSVKLAVVNECGRQGDRSTELFAMDPQTGLASTTSVLKTTLSADCRQCNHP